MDATIEGRWRLYLLERTAGRPLRTEKLLGGRYTQVLARMADSTGREHEVTFELGVEAGRDVLFIRSNSSRLTMFPQAGNLIRVTTVDLAREEDW